MKVESHPNRLQQIHNVLKDAPYGLTIREVAVAIKANRNSAAKYLDVMHAMGQVEVRPIGRAKLFYLSSRIPLSALLNYSSDYIIVFNQDLEIIQINDAVREALPSEPINTRSHRGFQSILTEYPTLQSCVTKALAGEESQLETGLQIDTNDGYYKIKVLPTIFEDGNDGATLLMEDITQQRNAEELLRKSEARYRLLFEHAPVGIGISTMDGTIVTSNHTIQQMMGYTRDEFHSMNVAQVFLDLTDREQLRDTVEHEKYVSKYPIKLKRKDGSSFDALLTITYVDLNSESVFQTICQDISDKIKTERRLQELNILKEYLLTPQPFEAKMKHITETVLEILDVEFANIWLLKPGDLCTAQCFYSTHPAPANRCTNQETCLHLIASSGRNAQIKEPLHQRVPLDNSHVGSIATGRESSYQSNDIVNDTYVHHQPHARTEINELGLRSFAGYRLLSSADEPIGVITFMNNTPFTNEDHAFMEDIATTTSHVIQTTQHHEDLELLSHALDEAMDGIIILNLDGTICNVNKPIVNKYGLHSKKDMIGEQGINFIAPEDRSEVMTVMTNLMHTMGSQTHKHHIIDATGERILVQANCVVMKNAAGLPIGIICTIRAA